MSRKKAGGPPRHQRGMPQARDLRDGVTGQPLEQTRRASTTISQGYRGKDVLAGKAHQPHPRDLWALTTDTWMAWNCADCRTRIPRREEHYLHRQTGSRRCAACQAWTYPE